MRKNRSVGKRVEEEEEGEMRRVVGKKEGERRGGLSETHLI